MGKLLSVSIAAFNAEGWLKRCLDTFIVPEIMDMLDIIIVNDGSTDATGEIAGEYERKYPHVFRVINKENGGHGSTVNTAIPIAKGKYFKIVDADDWVEKEGLADLVVRLENIDTDAILSPYYIVSADDEEKQLRSCLLRQNELYDRQVDVAQLGGVLHELQMHALTFRTSMIQEHFITLDEKCFYVDIEFIAFYFNYVKSVFITNLPIYDYLVGTAGQSINIQNMIKCRDQHLRVCKRLLLFISASDHCSMAVNGIIESFIMIHYYLLIGIADDKQSQSEIVQFDKYLKAQNNQIYRSTIINYIKKGRKLAFLILWLRLFHFWGYGFIHNMVKNIVR